MKLALDDLHGKKLREGKRRAQGLLTQWEQAIQQVKEDEKRVGCPLVPKDSAIDTPSDLGKQLPDANYLAVVEICDRAAERLRETVSHARTSLQQEIRRCETAQKQAEAGIVAAQATRDATLSRAESECASKVGSKLPAGVGRLFAFIGAVAPEIGLGIWYQARFESWKRSSPPWPEPSDPNFDSITKTISEQLNSLSRQFVPYVLFSWLVGLLTVLGAIKVYERLLANSVFNRMKHRIAREFEGRLFEHTATIAESTNRLKAAQAALSRLPPAGSGGGTA